MKITKKDLEKIITEEIEKVLQEQKNLAKYAKYMGAVPYLATTVAPRLAASALDAGDDVAQKVVKKGISTLQRELGLDRVLQKIANLEKRIEAIETDSLARNPVGPPAP
jgi:hypothetical protein